MGVRRWYFECCDSLRMSSVLGEDVVSGRDGRRMHGDQAGVAVLMSMGTAGGAGRRQCCFEDEGDDISL